ncbi:type I-E CRISPR-associated protein Cse1/CasA [Bradyrhizobium sp. DASA03120]|uniref:type I-E CRISPR-associated protein Cse1/CasA n=1 Tax=Bradyrhizobium sp. SMVTL-02 TaxID=3395917 RepID=UPI003F71DF0A
MPLNCLEEPLLTTTIDRGPAHLSLPSLYSALMRDVVEDMPAVRPHQRQALHAFLVQVGALAHLKAKIDTPVLETSVWARLLRGLTETFTSDEPWSLVVEDISKPGLLQPSVPEGTLDILRQRSETPDALDILATSKNHDVKAQRMAIARPEHWFYALLTLQTMQGYLGAGNYGINRMNGGYASRASVGLAPNGGLGARVKRDLRRLLQERSDVLNDNPWFADVNGIDLVWIEPWDRVSPIVPKQLDPFYVEVCRRVRLVRQDGSIVALRARSKAARIAFPKDTNG